MRLESERLHLERLDKGVRENLKNFDRDWSRRKQERVEKLIEMTEYNRVKN